MLKIFITNLGKYNEGELIGEWVELPCDELETVYERIGINDDYEEMFITDYESDIDGLEIGEYSNIEELNDLAETLEALDEYDKEIVGARMENGDTLETAVNGIDDCMFYHDCYTMGDVAEQYLEMCDGLNAIPEHLRYYFDFDAYGRDMSFEGTFIFTDSGCVEILY